MSESVQLAQVQAHNMNQALADVSNLGTSDQQSITNQLDTRNQLSSAQEPKPKSFADIDGSRDTGPAGDALLTQPQPTESPDIAKITNIDTLIVEWSPRYDAAKVAYVKFSASVNNAKSRAADYFAQQQAITEQIRDPDNQAKARQEDERDLILYRQWETKAHLALDVAEQIGIQLDDMDANLRKVKLRAGFVFDTSQFQEMPQAIDDLNRQLADFQTASENIKAATGSPFEAN